MIKSIAAAALITAVGVGIASAAVSTLSSVPNNAKTVTDWYKQSVYDRNNNKIGSIDDVLLDSSGHVSAFMVGVGGFLGAGEKDVAVPFDAIQATKKNNEWYLTMDASKDSLKSAPGFKYDSSTTTWTLASK